MQSGLNNSGKSGHLTSVDDNPEALRSLLGGYFKKANIKNIDNTKERNPAFEGTLAGFLLLGIILAAVAIASYNIGTLSTFLFAALIVLAAIKLIEIGIFFYQKYTKKEKVAQTAQREKEIDVSKVPDYDKLNFFKDCVAGVQKGEVGGALVVVSKKENDLVFVKKYLDEKYYKVLSGLGLRNADIVEDLIKTLKNVSGYKDYIDSLESNVTKSLQKNGVLLDKGIMPKEYVKQILQEDKDGTLKMLLEFYLAARIYKVMNMNDRKLVMNELSTQHSANADKMLFQLQNFVNNEIFPSKENLNFSSTILRIIAGLLKSRAIDILTFKEEDIIFNLIGEVETVVKENFSPDVHYIYYPLGKTDQQMMQTANEYADRIKGRVIVADEELKKFKSNRVELPVESYLDGGTEDLKIKDAVIKNGKKDGQDVRSKIVTNKPTTNTTQKISMQYPKNLGIVTEHYI